MLDLSRRRRLTGPFCLPTSAHPNPLALFQQESCLPRHGFGPWNAKPNVRCFLVHGTNRACNFSRSSPSPTRGTTQHGTEVQRQNTSVGINRLLSLSVSLPLSLSVSAYSSSVTGLIRAHIRKSNQPLLRCMKPNPVFDRL